MSTELVPVPHVKFISWILERKQETDVHFFDTVYAHVH
jgi:hypothetical protein